MPNVREREFGGIVTDALFRPNAHWESTKGRPISARVAELQEGQLSLHQQATAEAAASAKVTIESLIAETEAARIKAMESPNGAAAAVSAITAKAKLAGLWRERIDQHNSGQPPVGQIVHVIVAPRTEDSNLSRCCIRRATMSS
jgi:hypothetical protein